MASGGVAAITSSTAAGTKHVSASLWWDSFVSLSEDLDRAASSSIPDRLVERLRSHHVWFRDSLELFGPPNEVSRSALDASEVAVGSQRLVVKPELKDAALRASKCLSLDEVQSYILVNRSSELTLTTPDTDAEEFLHLVLVQYYLERQCLLKCIRRIFVHTSDGSDSNDAIREEALLLISEELEKRLLSIIQDCLATAFSVKAEAEITVSWLEETLIEINLIWDILFLAFYENFSRCNGELWKTMCSIFKAMLCGSYDVGKIAVSLEAKNSFHYSKAQLLLILIETLDFENLLRMVRDEVPFSGGYSAFSFADILEMDVEVSKLPELGMVESGPLVLAWAVFLCLVLSLPGSTANLEIDHTSYARRALELAPFNYLLGVLCSNIFRESDGPVSGFVGILRTFISAFVASYELSYQTEDSCLDMILSILCHIYDGEESLCMQFWDRDSFVDSPIRSVLHMVEKEYPFRIVEFIRFLSAVCKGTWPARCVYNYLERMSGITTLYAIPGGTTSNVNYYDQIEIHHPMSIPGVEGVTIPHGSHGYILKVFEDDVALVRWEFPHSGVLFLLLTLAKDLHSNNDEEAYDIMDLLYRMLSSNKELCFALLHADRSLSVQASKNLGQIEKHVRIDIVKIFCTSIFKYVQDVSNANITSRILGVLAEMLKCAPCHVFEVALQSSIFTSETNGPSSDWLLSGGLARMLFAVSEENGDCSLLTTSVLDFIIQVLDKGAAADDIISSLVVFSLQYIMVNHMNWKYKKHTRWKTTMKVFELVKVCVRINPFSSKLGGIIWEILLYDSSLHSVLWQILSMSTRLLQPSYASHRHGFKEIEDLQLVLCSTLDIVFYILSDLPEELLLNPPSFVSMVLSSASKPFPFVTAAIFLISFFQNSAIQAAAARAFSVLCFIAYKFQPQLMESANLVGDGLENRRLGTSISRILDEKENLNDHLILAIFNLLTSAARYQPALLVSLTTEENVRAPMKPNSSMNNQLDGSSILETSKSDAKLIEQILNYVERSSELMNSSPHLLLSILDLLKALWESGVQFMDILERLRTSKMFWENLSICVCAAHDNGPIENLDHSDSDRLSLRYYCRGKILEIMSHELFLQERLLAEVKSASPIPGTSKEQKEPSNVYCPRNILRKWCDSAIMENLINYFSCSGYEKELVHHAKVAACLCIIHLIMKLSTGDLGSLSFSLVKKIQEISSKLLEHHAFSALLSQYSLRGYSGKYELTNLVINDLYYHLQGELEGRQITPGPFQELLCFLLEFKVFQYNPLRKLSSSFPAVNDICLFDIPHICGDLGIDLWSCSDWKASKEVAEKMLAVMHKANLMLSCADARLFALRSLVMALSVYTGNSFKKKLALPDGGLSVTVVQSAVRCACKSFQSTLDSLIPEVDTNEVLFPFLSSQVELLLTLTRVLLEQNKQKKSLRQFYPVIVLLMKTSGASTSFLADFMPSSPALKQVVKSLLVLLLSLFVFIYSEENLKDEPDEVNLFAEASLASVSLLPVLCKLAENSEYSDLSVASMDLMLKGFLMSNVWSPVLQKHLRVQAILENCQDETLVSTQVVLNFLLTLGRTKDGAKILQSANIFSFLKVLLSQLAMDESFLRNSCSTQGKDVNICGLGLAIVTSVNHCLDDDISRTNIANNTINFLSEKVSLMSCYLSAQSISIHQSKKRALLQKSQTSLADLSLTENILALMCILARSQFLWDTGMKEIDSELREIIIHLLAFISRGITRTGDSPNWSSSFVCPPTVKEEVKLNEKPPLIRSKYGWFQFAAFSSLSTTTVSGPSNALSLVIRDKSSEDSDSMKQTRFTEMLAVQIYKIAFLIMKFLCIQAKEAVKRAEELEFLDLAHFPELPMPDILHGLQDQVVSIVTEVLEANRSRTLHPEAEKVCHLLLVILETSLYLELCISQSCGIRPVLGRVEDFSKEIKAMLHVIEEHSNFRPLVQSLNQITMLLYPGFLQSSGLM